MAELPRSELSLEENVSASAAGVNLICVIAPVAQNADAQPRFFANTDALLSRYLYTRAIDYCGIHMQETRRPVLFCGVPIATAGVVGRKNTSGNSGTCVVDVAVGAHGSLEETDGVLRVVNGGTIGTDQILLELSLNGGRDFKKVRLGTANSYTIPHVGLSLSFAAGTLVADDTVLTWHSTAPRWDQAGIQAAREALAAQQKQVRTWLVDGDLQVEADAMVVLTEANAYETAHDRFTVARVAVRDRLPFAELSQVQVRMTGSPSLTFATAADTVTRSAGSWISDGFVIGDAVTFSGSASNDITGTITALTDTVMTLDTNLTDEGPVANVTAVGTPGLTFAEVGATGDTITRSRGSWLDDGFRDGDVITITDTASNNLTDVLVTDVSATVLTLDTGDLEDEVIGSFGVSITAGETKAEHVAEMDAEFADVDAERHINIAFGRGWKASPILGYRFRRPSSWAASIREYQHDVHIPTWQKELGPLSGWDLEDEDGVLVEHDERVDGGALAARFTCLRTYSNDNGVFVALDLTRAGDDAALSLHHNMAVANVACQVVQKEAENAIGQVPTLKDDGTGHATPEALSQISSRVNTALQNALLSNVAGEGQRASSARWIPSVDDDLRGPNATLTYVTELNLRGTIVQVRGAVKVNAA